MELLDTPPEIFQNIIHELVSTAGVCEAWKLRLVCRNFAAEIRYDIFTKQPACSVSSDGAREIITSDIPLYLASRTKLLLGAHKYLPELITKMVDFFSQELQTKSYEQRQHLSKTICHCVDRAMRAKNLLGLLIGSKQTARKMVRQASHNRAKVTLAAALGELDLVQKLLLRIPKPKTYFEDFSTIFGHPLTSAAAGGHAEIVNFLSRSGRARLLWGEDKGTDRIDRTDRSTWSTWSTWTYTTGYLSWCDFFDAVRIALERRDLGMTRSLFELSTSFKVKVSKACYNLLLELAMKTGDIQFVELIKPEHPRYGSNVTVNQFIHACRGGNIEIVNTLLGINGMSPNSTFMTTTPLVAAVRSGHLNVVKAVLDAGASPNGKPNKSNSPLYIASHRGNEAIVKLLLENGAQVGNMELHTKSKAAYELLRQTKMRQDGVDLPDHATAIADKKAAARVKAQEKLAAKRKAKRDTHQQSGATEQSEGEPPVTAAT